MFRIPMKAALTATLLGSAMLAAPAFAQDAPYAPPAQLSPADNDNAQAAPNQRQAPAQADADRDMNCRRDAAARTGYVTPDQAAGREQANGSIGGTLAGAALGAIIGGASGNAGTGAAIGAGAGLIAGTAVGADNARAASADVQNAYASAYYACMNGTDVAAAPPPAYGPPEYNYDYPPPYYYGPAPYYPAYPAYYGPRLSFGFAFGGGYRGGYRPGPAFRGGLRHR
jgi:hypothetical protein